MLQRSGQIFGHEITGLRGEILRATGAVGDPTASGVGAAANRSGVVSKNRFVGMTANMQSVLFYDNRPLVIYN